MSTLWKKSAGRVYQPRLQLTFKTAKMAVACVLVCASFADAKIICLKSGNLRRSIDFNPELQISLIYVSIWLFREIYRETENMNFLLKLLFIGIGMLVK